MSKPLIKPMQQDETFLEDVRAPLASPGEIRLWWLGQSGYLIKWIDPSPNEGGLRHMLIDPYLSDSLTAKYLNTEKPHVRMTERVVDPLRLDFIDVVTSSHSHTDHLDAQTLRPLLQVNPMIEVVAPRANEASVVERLQKTRQEVTFIQADDPIHTYGPVVTGIPAAHDKLETDENGHQRYLGYVFDFLDGRTIYHSGDTVLYDGLIETLRPFNVDLAILPINGKVGNMNGTDAARLAKAIGAKLVIPCHYEMFEFNTADPRDQFVPTCEELGQPYKVLRAGEKLTLDPKERSR